MGAAGVEEALLGADVLIVRELNRVAEEEEGVSSGRMARGDTENDEAEDESDTGVAGPVLEDTSLSVSVLTEPSSNVEPDEFSEVGVVAGEENSCPNESVYLR